MPRTDGRPALVFLLAGALALGVGGAAGCNDGDGDSTSAGGDSTSGGESAGGGSGSGDLEAPEGSTEPGDDGSADPAASGGDGAGESGGETAAAAQGGGAPSAPSGGSSSSGGGGASESPWGSPLTQTGRPLPPRRQMNAAAAQQYRQGVRAASQGQLDAARRAFRAAASADGNAYKAHYNLGVLADRAGDERQAIQHYQAALRIQPDYELAIRGIAVIHLRNGDAGRAVSFVRPLATRWARNLHVQAIYGETLIGAGRPEEAITAARAALRRDERFVPAMIVLVKANMRLGRTELAESILNAALEVDANNAELQYLRGRSQQEQGNLGPALEAYRRAVQLQPSYVEARMALGFHLLAGGNYPQALEQFQATARLAPRLPAVRLALGDAYRSLKQWNEAKAEFDRVQQMDARNAQVHFNAALMYLAAKGDFPGLETLAALQRAVTEFNRYRELMASRLPRDDPSTQYLEELNRLIEREQRRIERARAREQRARERAARQAQEAAGGGGDSGGE